MTFFPAQGLIDSIPSHDVPMTACANGYDFMITDSTELKKRPGFEDVNASAVSSSPSITSLMSLYLSQGDKYELVGGNNGSVWRMVQASGDSPTGQASAAIFVAATFSTTQPVDFTQFLDTGIFMDGATAARIWTATAASAMASGTITAAPFGKYGELHLNKFFITGIAGALSRVDYTTTGSYATWAGAGSGSFNVDQNDGSVCKGLRSFSSNELVIFKEKSMWKLLGQSSADFTLMNIDQQIGCISNRSIALYEGVMIFASRNGIYVYDGSSPKKISGYIQNIWDTINMAVAENFTATIDPDRGLYCLSVATDANTVNNLMLVFDARHPWTDSEGLHFPCFPWRVPALSLNHEIDSGSKGHLMFGGALGKKYYFSDSVYQDNGTSFEFIVDSPLTPFGDGIGNQNCLRRVYVPYKNTAGTIEFYTCPLDGSTWTQWDSISSDSPAAAIGVDFIIGVSPIGAATITGTSRINTAVRSRRMKLRFRNYANEFVQIDAPVELYYKGRGDQRG
jgi:hypothetical protein